MGDSDSDSCNESGHGRILTKSHNKSDKSYKNEKKKAEKYDEKYNKDTTDDEIESCHNSLEKNVRKSSNGYVNDERSREEKSKRRINIPESYDDYTRFAKMRKTKYVEDD